MFTGNFPLKQKKSLLKTSLYLSNFNGCDRARGGVAVVVSDSVPHRPININTSLQATAVSIS